MSAPAALAFAKLFYPETEKSKTKADNITIEEPQEANVLDAATQGATSAGLLVVNITAIVVAFIAFMAFISLSCEVAAQRSCASKRPPLRNNL